MQIKKQRWQDIRYGISAVLLILTLIVAITGFIADRWGLHNFVIHTVTGYVMTAVAVLHTVFELPRLIAYARHRLRKLGGKHQSTTTAKPVSNNTKDIPARTTPAQREKLLTRRDLAGLLLGSIAGFLLGRTRIKPATAPDEGDLGAQYHAWSKAGGANLFGTLKDWGTRPPLYKTYPQAETITLPKIGEFRGLYTEEAIQKRRSIREYAKEPISVEMLSRLLYYTDGINTKGRGLSLRSAPSAGALYPIEIYLAIHNVETLQPGLYHYGVQDHILHILSTDDPQEAIVRGGIMQGFLGDAAVVFILTAIFQRLRWKYRERSYRYALLESGHLGQNIYLAATSMGMGACAVGAFLDDPINSLLGVDGTKEAVVYMLAVGNT